jgi:hypothetical protein
MTYVIAEPCIDVKDKSCIEECPVDCIYESDRMLYIQPDEGDDPLGSPGGAAKVGPLTRDADYIASYVVNR